MISELESTPKQLLETHGQTPTDLNINRKGDIAEQFVCMIAQFKGAEVFHNVSRVGATDIILKIGDQLVQIDVKLATWSKNTKSSWYWNTASGSKVKAPVYPVMVIPEGDIREWTIKWKKGNCPTGLENFWN